MSSRQQTPRPLPASCQWARWTLVGSSILASQTLLASPLVVSTELFNGSETADYTFTAPTAGTLDIKLTDLDWPVPFSNLFMSVTTATGVLGSLNMPGEISFDLSSGGVFFAHVFGKTQGGLNLGAYSLNCSFEPIAPVPLPDSGWLLVGSLMVAGGMCHRWMKKPEALGTKSAA